MSFIEFTFIQAPIPLLVSASDPGYLKSMEQNVLNDFSWSFHVFAYEGLKLSIRVDDGISEL